MGVNPLRAGREPLPAAGNRALALGAGLGYTPRGFRFQDPEGQTWHAS